MPRVEFITAPTIGESWFSVTKHAGVLNEAVSATCDDAAMGLVRCYIDLPSSRKPDSAGLWSTQ